jgi:hypothetical protein
MKKKKENKIHKNEECISGKVFRVLFVFRLVQSKRNAFEEKKRKRKKTAFTEIFVVGLTFFTKCLLQF